MSSVPAATTHVLRKVAKQSTPLRDILDVLFRRKAIAFFGCVLFSIALLAFVLTRPKSYESHILFLVKSDRTHVEVSPYQTNATLPQEEAGDVKIGTEIQLLLSQDLHREVIQQDLKNAGDSARKVGDVEWNMLLQKFEKNLKVVPIPKSSLIRASFIAPDKDTARETLRILGDRYMNYHLKLHGSGGTYEFFSQQASLYQGKLAEAQKKLAQFENRTKITLLTEQKDLNLRKLTGLRASLNEARTTEQETRQRILQLTHQLDEVKPRITTQRRTVPNQYSVDRLNTLLVELQNKRTDLLVKFRPEDRLVQEVDQQISDTKQALDRAQRMTATEEATDVNPLRQALESELSKAEINSSGLRVRQNSLQGQIHSDEQELAKLDLATATHEKLQQDVKEAADNYQLYSRKREEARISGALDNEKIANLAVAEGPTQPLLAKPRLTLATVCAFVLGNLFIVGLIVLLGLRHTVVYAPWELEAFTEIPVLATVPLDHNRRAKSLPGRVDFSVPALTRGLGE